MSFQTTLLNHLYDKRTKFKRTKISKEGIIQFAANHDSKKESDIRFLYYMELVDYVDELIQSGLLKPIGKSKSGKVLSNEYWILPSETKVPLEEEYIHELNSYTYLNLSYYKSRKKEFYADKDAIDLLYQYYRKPDKRKLTANELGFLLFRDEKAFEQKEEGTNRKSIGYYASVLKRIGLTLEMINSYTTIEPFFYCVRKEFFETEKREILIVENKDTFFTLKPVYDKYGFHMLIYGEGQKINKSFELAKDYGITTYDKVCYFGDIDPAGFAIYNTFRSRFHHYQISLYLEFYECLMDSFSFSELKKIRNDEKAYVEVAKQVINAEFKDEYQSYLMELLEQGLYIPQEAIAIANDGGAIFCLEDRLDVR